MPHQNKAAERWPMIETLSKLGWGSTPIAQAIGWSQGSVAKDLQAMGGSRSLFPDRPAGTHAVYTATFLFWAQHPDLENPLRSGIGRFLQINLLQAFSNGMNRAYEALCLPTYTPELRPYVELMWNACFVRITETPDPLANYIRMVGEGELDPPKSFDEVLVGMSRLFHQSANRSNLMMRTDGLREALDEWLSTSLPPRQEKVLILRWGLQGQHTQTLEEIGAQLEVTRETVRRLEVDGLSKLRRPIIRKKLGSFFLTMGELYKNFKKAQEELAKTEDFLQGEKPLNYFESRIERDKLLAQLHQRCDELELSLRSANCLEDGRLTYIWQLCQKSEAELLRTKNFGRKSLNEIKEILSEMGLRLGMNLVALLGDEAPR